MRRPAAALLILAAQTAFADDLDRTVVSGGAARAYRVHVPPELHGEAPVPVVLVLHGGGGNASSIAKTTGMDAAADRNGFLAVYPNGSGFLRDRLLTWNAGACCGWAVHEKVDDAAFIRKVLDAVSGEWRVDEGRVFATGMSNGGMMSYRLGCELAGRIAAIAPVAGALDVSPCAPLRPVSLIAFHGTGVVLVTILGGGHAWPGGTKGFPGADPPTREVDATAEMWEFFSGHGRPRAEGVSPAKK